ncbi:integrase core domain-containing protein [Chitinibacter sp. FCG-7]|uniref:Integrase core domain-containing protein n=1 Tax=Chitinibacter mangrovi TaxID=3153927 RepID=A0AAU7F9W9_9NEIS
MPWQEVKPMDEKVKFIADYLRGDLAFKALCGLYGISRKTGYKWVQRYRAQGIDGLQERSRRPHAPAVTPYIVREAVLKFRNYKGDVLGAKKIQPLLLAQFGEAQTPSQTTIYNILKSAGCVKSRSRVARTVRSIKPLKVANQANQLWSVDYKGQFKLGNGQWCYPLTVMDHASRYLLSCEGLCNTTTADAKAVFERLFREYGLPERIRSDNGCPFASVGVGGLSKLAIWWIRLGIIPERITPGQPQQNGRHERMHRTLKQRIGAVGAADLVQQQMRLDEFRQHYNEGRLHEGLGQQVPSSAYAKSTRSYPEQLPELVYPDYFERGRVCQSGLIYWRSLRVYIGYLLRDEWIGLELVDEGIWDVYFGPVRLGSLDEREVKGAKNDYLRLFNIKSVTHVGEVMCNLCS